MKGGFNLLKFLDAERRPKMLCMMCKRCNCREQICPGDDDPENGQNGGFTCQYFQAMSTPISDDMGVDILADIFVSEEDSLFERQEKMERVLIEILLQHGYEKTAKAFKEYVEVPF